MQRLWLDLIQKITGVVCEDKKDVIVYLIHKALEIKALEKTKTIILQFSKEDIWSCIYKEQR